MQVEVISAPNPNTPRVGTGVFVRAGLWLAVLALACWFITRIQFTLGVFSLAWLIAYLMNPLVEMLEGRRLGPIKRCSRGMAIGALYCLLVSLAAVGCSFLVPALTSQIDRLVALHETIYDPHELASTIQQHGERFARLVPVQYQKQVLGRLSASLDTITAQVGKIVAAGVSHLADFLGQVLAGTIIFLSGLLISIYMLIGWKTLGVGVVQSFPARYQGEVMGLLQQMNRIFGGYLRATVLTSIACALAVVVAISCYSLISGEGVPYAYVISLIAGLTYPIPLFGILSSTVIGGVLAFLPENNLHTALWVGGLVFLASNIIDRALQPKLMSKAIGVSPLFVIFAAAAGGEFLGGVWGMLLGIPLAAMMKALFVWFHDHFLVDPASNPPRRRRSDRAPAPDGAVVSIILPPVGRPSEPPGDAQAQPEEVEEKSLDIPSALE